MSTVSQLLLMGVPGVELDAATARRLKMLQPGGFIIFGRNIESPEKLRRLIDDLRDLSEVEPIVTIDQEGGRVSRLRLLGSEPPNARQLSTLGNEKLIHRHGELTGRILRQFGFNLDLCPVLDVSWQGDENNSLKGRTWGETPQEVISNAGIFTAELRRQGILSCGKHFPGYAHAEVDAHHELPVLHRTMAELEGEELVPYRAMLDVLDSLMICHSHYPAFDPDSPRLPASLSRHVIRNFLRGQLGYDGLVMTDDLDMGAILNEYGFEEMIRMAVEAGNDLVMICHRVDMVEQAVPVLEKLPAELIHDALLRIEKFKRKMSPPDAFSLESFAKIDAEIWDLRVQTLGEDGARVLSVEDGKRSPVELY